MKRYDRHMNQHGHFSMLKKPNELRSPILDQIIRSGQALASDYLERMGPPPEIEEAQPDVADAVNSEQPANSEHQAVNSDAVNSLQSQLDAAEYKSPEWYKLYRALGRAKSKEGK